MRGLLALFVALLFVLSVLVPAFNLVLVARGIDEAGSTEVVRAVEDVREELRRLRTELGPGVGGILEPVASRLDEAASAAVRMQVFGGLLSRSIGTALIASVLLAFGASVGMVFLFRNRVVAPIRRMARFVDETAVPLPDRLPTQRRAVGELRSLGNAMNAMLDRIDSQAARLQQAQRESIGKFLAHQVKNSLTPILLAAGNLRLMARHPAGSPGEAAAALGLIESQAQRLRRLVEQFRALHRFPERVLRPVNPLTWMRQARDTLAAEYSDLVLELAEASPAYAGPGEPSVSLDPDLMLEALRNIVANSADAGARRVVFVPILDPESGRQVGLDIHDDGRGLPANGNDTERLFAEDVTTKAQGMGIGLAFVRRVCRAHGFRVGIRNGTSGAHPVGAIVEIRRDAD